MVTRFSERGLSFIEMVVAIALLGLVVATFYGLLTTAVRGWGGLEGQLDVQQIPRVAAGRVVGEVRQARDFMIGGGGTALSLVKATILTQDAARGDTSVTVEDASVLAVNRPAVLLNLNRLEQVTATAITGTTVTLSAPLTFPHKQGEAVRRAQSTLTVPVAPGATTVDVADGTVFQVGDSVAVEDESPLQITAVSGPTLTITPALAQSHDSGAVVQPLTVVFQLTGNQLTRCTQSCATPSNRIVLADFLAAPAGRQLFATAATTLASPATVGDTQVCVQIATGFAVNDQIQIDRDTYGGRVVTAADRRIITGIGTSVGCLTGVLTLDRGVTAPRAAGRVVRVRAVDINMMATRFNDVVQQTQEVAVTSRAVLRN